MYLMEWSPIPFCSPSIKLALKAAYELDTPSKPKAPIIYPILVHMVDLLQCDPNNLVWSAILTLAFFGALHGAEYNLVVDSHGTTIAPLPLVSNISFGVTPHGVHFMTYWVSKSKTHPHGLLSVIGCSGTRVCAVCAMTLYLSNRNAGRQLSSCAPLFILHNGQAINKTLVNTKIKTLVSQLALSPSDYSTHSLRAGSVASAGFTKQFANWEIIQMGNWSSNIYHMYIHNNELHKVGYAKRITHSLPPDSA